MRTILTIWCLVSLISDLTHPGTAAKEATPAPKSKKPLHTHVPKSKLADDSNVTCPPPRGAAPAQIVVLLAHLSQNASGEAVGTPIVAAWWRHGGWRPLVLAVGDGWETPRGERIRRELRCVPDLLQFDLHLCSFSWPEPAAVPWFAAFLEGVPPDAFLLVAPSNVLPVSSLELLRQPSASVILTGEVANDPAAAPDRPRFVGMSAPVWRRRLASLLGCSPEDRFASDVFIQMVARVKLPDGGTAGWLRAALAGGGPVSERRSTRPHPVRHWKAGAAPVDVTIGDFQLSDWPPLQEFLRHHRFKRLQWQRLQRYVLELHPPVCRTPAPPAFQGRFFYFGVTHPSLHHLLEACHATWAGRLPGMVWYSTSAHPLVTHVMGTDARGLTSRMAQIWNHVHQHYGGFDWYVRCWEDNYVFPQRLEYLALSYNASRPLQVGQAGVLKQRVPFLLGGPPSLWTRAALQLLFREYGPSLAGCVRLCARHALLTPWMEDVCWSYCGRRVSLQLEDHCGFYAYSPFLHPVGLSESDVICGVPGLDDRYAHRLPCSAHPSYLGPLAFHYVKDVGVMRRIHALTQKSCRLCPPAGFLN
eukprot:EG_transcript_7238